MTKDIFGKMSATGRGVIGLVFACITSLLLFFAVKYGMLVHYNLELPQSADLVLGFLCGFVIGFTYTRWFMRGKL